MSATASQILVRGAKQNNLKSLDLDLSPGEITVFTGLSGSGKTTLLFDVIHAEGQRKYVETFSPYVRQFLDTMPRPEVDGVFNIRPSISVEQKNTIRNSRSTVGTMTELCDYFKVWFPQVAELFDPSSGKRIVFESPETLAKGLLGKKTKELVYVGFIVEKPKSLGQKPFLNHLIKTGYGRILTSDGYQRIEDCQDSIELGKEVFVVVDRVTTRPSNRNRLVEAITTATGCGFGCGQARDSEGCLIAHLHEGLRSPEDGRVFDQPSPSMFSFNSPIGACSQCKGFGRVIEINPELVVPDSNLSIREGAIRPFNGKVYGHCQNDLLENARMIGLRDDLPWSALSEEEKTFVWEGDPNYSEGNGKWYGINKFFKWLEKKTYKMHVRVFLSKYRGYFTCPSCSGDRLKNESLLWQWRKFTLPQLYRLPVDELYALIEKVPLSGNPKSDVSLQGIKTRLEYLQMVGLGYLSLDRAANTLSGGETQRVNLTACLGASLTDTLFALDEPTIGLHDQDIGKLIQILRSLADAGNYVCVVEHDEQVIRAADKIIELGPSAGAHGGEIIFNGTVARMLRSTRSLTGKWLNNNPSRNKGDLKDITNPKVSKYLRIKKASRHNLRNFSQRIPLGQFVCIAGVSGSGKSTLLNEVIHHGLTKSETIPSVRSDHSFSEVALIDQSSVARTPRSNPVMYADAWGPIREAFGRTDDAKRLGFFAGDFSFNSGNGRCEACKGLGYQEVEMQFLSDIQIPCEHCEGKRFKDDLLEVKLDGLSVFEVLNLTIEESLSRFSQLPKTSRKLSMLSKVGLGYLKLGQPLNTLSGGESQRLKLVKYMSDFSKGVKPCLLLIDEPTTGLHFEDVDRLLKCLFEIRDAGHSLIVIEHNPQVLKSADWILELGPGAGKSGGRKVASGPPESLSTLNTATALSIRKPLGDQSIIKRGGGLKRTKGTRSIRVLGARENNLKNVSLTMPANQFVVVTGPSGSGKSSFAFDVVFAEGQRRFMDSMSSYARQFVQQLGKPLVDEVHGLSPTVAIEQRVTRGTRKSTVASITEVAQHLRLLYSRAGIQLSVRGRRPLVTSTFPQVSGKIRQILQKSVPNKKNSVVLLAPLVTNRKGHHKPLINWAREQGFSEVRCDQEFIATENFQGLDRYVAHDVEAVVARWTSMPKRLSAFIARAIEVGKGRCGLLTSEDQEVVWLSTKLIDPETGEAYPELEPSLLSWNSPKGWCSFCHGYGRIFDWMKDRLPANGNWWQLKDGETCPECQGERLAPIGRNVVIFDQKGRSLSLPQLLELAPRDAISFLERVKVSSKTKPIINAIVPEVIDRLSFMEKVGLDYLCLNRETSSLSGGESQRIRLAGQLGSNLSGVLYVLDEPSIGLHPMDNSRLIASLRELQSRGNSLLVVEHDQETIQQADYLIDVGPLAGRQGGEIVAHGKPDEVFRNERSLTGQFMRNGIPHPLRKSRRDLCHSKEKSVKRTWLELSDVHYRNLKGVSVQIPTECLVVVCGVSGSGKSSLIRGVLKDGIRVATENKTRVVRKQNYKLTNGNHFGKVIEVSQSPIGKTSRSTPATYLGIWDHIRKLMANLPEAKAKGLTASDFSFNVKGGRCEACKGVGKNKVEMNFLPDSYVVCQECKGLRYRREILELRWKGKSVADILDLNFAEAERFFNFDHFLKSTFGIMIETGLDYLKLGQVSPTLSGGEAQRLKLGAELASGIDKGKYRHRAQSRPNLYILEEPTIGLHTKDCQNLILLLHRLIDEGNTIILIEHDVDLIAEADYLIELGPVGGNGGGRLLHQGTVEKILTNKKSKTAPFLRKLGQLG